MHGNGTIKQLSSAFVFRHLMLKLIFCKLRTSIVHQRYSEMRFKNKGIFFKYPKGMGGQGGERRRETRRKGRQEEKRGRENRKF